MDKVKDTITKILASDQEEYSIMSKGTLVSKYLTWLSEYVDIKEDEKKENRPFLSIITRTQGKRPEALQETLLCLAGQSDMDFELLILGHKLDDEQNKLVNDIIENQVEELRKRIKFIPVDYGTRTTPLNVGFEESNGNYIAILDDDDIVFDNWVEMFKKAACEKPGAILHAYSLSQNWSVVKRDVDALRAESAPTYEYCKDFDYFEQISMNYCPPVGLAFPRYAFQNCGIKFDETLNTTEDWDLLMRMAFITNVVDIKEPTCIYRIWANTETSRTLHGIEEWQKNHYIIEDKFEKIPMVFEAGIAGKLRKEIEAKKYAEDRVSKMYEAPLVNKRNISPVIYLNYGEAYSEANTMCVSNTGDDKWLKYEYCISDDKAPIVSFRWDPDVQPLLAISNITFEVEYEDESKEIKEVKNSISNGYLINEKLYFLKEDPQVEVLLDGKKKVSQITVKCNVSFDIEEKIYLEEFNKMGKTNDWSALYYASKKENFNESKKITSITYLTGKRNTVEFDGFDTASAIEKFRFDPCEEGGVTLILSNVIAVHSDGSRTSISLEKVDTNGIKRDNYYIFAENDPWVVIKNDTDDISSIVVEYTINNYISNSDLQYYINGIRGGMNGKKRR